jgi:hypothetical protein
MKKYLIKFEDFSFDKEKSEIEKENKFEKEQEKRAKLPVEKSQAPLELPNWGSY